MVKVLTNGILCVLRGDVIEMALKSVHKSPLGLSHILCFASFASDILDKVSALAIYPGFGGVTSLNEGADDMTRDIKSWDKRI